jgi:hypothetical protein
MRVAWAIVLLAACASANPMPADTSTVQILSASASVEFVSHDGCIQNEVSIFIKRTTALQGASKETGTRGEATYSRSRYDLCEDTDLGTDVGSSSAAVLSGDLQRIHLDIAIEGVSHAIGRGLDAAVPPVRISFSLTWSGTGNIHRVGGSPGTSSSAKVVVRQNSQSRGATVGGQVDGEEIFSGSIGSIMLTTRQTIAR